MTDINFYHLEHSNLESTLPVLLEKSVEAGFNVVVKSDTSERIDAINNHLWTYDPAKFLPHGAAKDGFAEHQPIWLTMEDENPNSASLLVLTDNTDTAQLDTFQKCLNIFNGNDDTALHNARENWKKWKESGHNLAYFQQVDGKWVKKAG